MSEHHFFALGIILGGICLSASRAKANGCVRCAMLVVKSRATQHGLEMGVNLWEIYTSLHALAHNTARFLLPFLNLIYSKSNLWTQFIIPSWCFSNVSKIQYFTLSCKNIFRYENNYSRFKKKTFGFWKPYYKGKLCLWQISLYIFKVFQKNILQYT